MDTTNETAETLRVEDDYGLMGRLLDVLATMSPKQLGEIVDFARFQQNRKRILGQLPIATTIAA